MPAGRPRLNDEFATLEISRQKRWQLRRQKAGLCLYCGLRELATTTRCIPCADAHRKKARSPKADRVNRVAGNKRRTLTFRVRGMTSPTLPCPPNPKKAPEGAAGPAPVAQN